MKIRKIKKKPIVVETVQYTGNNIGDIEKWSNKKLSIQAEDGSLIIPTLEGNLKANIGDWIIRGVRGEIYAIKPDILEETYEDA